MIDIIIPTDAEYEKILETLFSICVQTIREKIKVYIIVTKFDERYENIKKIFENKLDMIIVYLEDTNLGIARNKGIEISQNPYILFLNSGDRIYHGYSLKILLDSIEDNDISYGIEVLQKDDGNIIYNNSIKNKLNSKLYKREFIEKNNILFNNIDKYSEIAFDILTSKLTEKICFIDEYIVFNKEENNFEFYDFKKYIENIEWLIKEYKKRNLLDKVIALEINSVIIYSYFEYLKYIKNKDVNKICKWLNDIMNLYNKYKDLLTIDDIENEYLYYYSKQSCVIPNLTLNDFIKKFIID